MKVAQVSTRFPPGPGGVERHVAEVARRLGARGHAVDVYTSDLYREYPWERLGPEVPREETFSWGRVHRLPVRTLPGELHYPWFRGLGPRLAASAPDVVHVHTYGTHQVAIARRVRRGRGIPFVLSAHYHPIWSIEGGWFRHRLRGFYDRRIGGRLLRDAAAVIVQTAEERRLLEAPGLRLPRVETIPPGYTPLPPAASRGAFRDRYRIVGPYLLFVGRLASNKGLLPLVDSFTEFRRHHPDAELVVVGEDGGMRASVEERVRAAGVGASVHLLGHVADEALLADAYRDARATVLPSEYEAFGLVLLESLAQGTPVIASRIGGIPEFIPDGRAGLLVPPGAVAELAGAMAQVWEDPARAAAWGRFGQQEVVPRYSWDRVVDALERLYVEVGRR